MAEIRKPIRTMGAVLDEQVAAAVEKLGPELDLRRHAALETISDRQREEFRDRRHAEIMRRWPVQPDWPLDG
jgi:hypothetical protein